MTNKMRAVISLFDLSGIISRPYLDAGYVVYQFDQQLEFNLYDCNWHIGGDYREWTPIIDSIYDQYDVSIILSQPPCTDLTSSQAGWMERKRLANPDYENEAMDLVFLAKRISEEHDGTPYVIENPVGRISTLWRKPDMYYHPYEFGAWLPEDDVAPNYVTPARDRYSKRSCLWHNEGFIEPVRKPVELPAGYTYSLHHLKLGGRTLKTKNLRSLTPRGFALALFDANHKPREKGE